MKLKYYLTLMIAFTLSTTVYATTWRDKKVADPVKPGSWCKVKEPASWNSNVYQGASRFDQVFWPYIVANGIWFCKDSGFIAFVDDFKVSAQEKKALSRFLKKNRKISREVGEGYSSGKIDIKKTWQWLESVYRLRNKDKAFRNRLFRRLAFVHERAGDYNTADRYRRKALEQIKSMLAGKLSITDRLRYLYIAANYEKHFGNKAASDRYLRKLNALTKKAGGEQEKSFAGYIKRLARQTRWITPVTA